ncbi:MAG TPA: HAMP domain-containing sensor histidine kinase, partial [Armatimonadota bacterium]
MTTRKLPLARMVLRQHLLALFLALGVTLCVLLVLADQIEQRLAALDLSAQLRAIPTVEAPDTLASQFRRGRLGLVVLNADGSRLRRERTGQPDRDDAQRHPLAPWTEASHVVAEGEVRGSSALPWTRGQVVWAARAVPTASGQRVLVTWVDLRAIRIGARMVYGSVVIATLLTFLACVLLALRVSNYTTGVIREVIRSSRKMMAGDYSVHLPEQPVLEFDELSAVITKLAGDLAQATETLEEDRRQLTRLETLQRQFVADASHELRAPLAAMSITLAAWEDGMLTVEERPEALTKLRREAKRLGALVTQLLDLSRVESGRELLSLQAVDATEVMRDVAESFRHLPGAPIEIPAQPAHVSADRDALYRIFYNLTENAWRFTPPTGSIRLWVEPSGDRLRLGVTDTGSGIAAQD